MENNTKKGYKTLKRDFLIVMIGFGLVISFQYGRFLGRIEGIEAVRVNCR